MHPNPAFRTDADPLAFASARGFAHVFAATPAGPMVAHGPVTRHGDTLRFHLARANRLFAHADGAAVLLLVTGADGYISPNWYARPGNQVPTWNYEAVEIDGVAHAIDEAGLREHLDALADIHEPRPDPWTLAKTDPAAVAAMLRAIGGFAVTVAATRTTTKLSQNKPAADRAGVVAGLRARGNPGLAARMVRGD